MNSEKVKEIKEALEQNDDNGIIYEVNDKKRLHYKRATILPVRLGD